jgi:hypothetical protein
MTTRRIANAVSQTNSLAAAAETHAGAVAAGIQAVADNLGVTLKSDPKLFLLDLAALARAAGVDVTAKDEALSGEKTVAKAPAGTRDDDAILLHGAVRALRQGIALEYGPKVAASVFPAGETPRDPKPLVSYASQVAANVGTHSSKWTALPNATTSIDIPTSLTRLAALTAKLEKDLGTVDAGAHGQAAQKSVRDAAERIHHGLHLGLEQTLGGALEAAQLPAVADSLVHHHHISHPHAAPAPAPAPTPPAGTGTPTT